jgi:hypothetical protein
MALDKATLCERHTPAITPLESRGCAGQHLIPLRDDSILIDYYISHLIIKSLLLVLQCSGPRFASLASSSL